MTYEDLRHMLDEGTGMKLMEKSVIMVLMSRDAGALAVGVEALWRGHAYIEDDQTLWELLSLARAEFPGAACDAPAVAALLRLWRVGRL